MKRVLPCGACGSAWHGWLRGMTDVELHRPLPALLKRMHRPLRPHGWHRT